jgi:hypothetical protein
VKLIDTLQTLTAYRVATERAIRQARAVAANPTTPPPVAQEMTALADELQATLDSGRLVSVTLLALDELKDLALSGKSIVGHQAADLF